MQLSEDHTLLSRMQAAGVEPTDENPDASNRWKGVLTNALGIGGEPRVAIFIIPLYSGDRIVLVSDGVHEYVTESEVGEIVVEKPSPGRAAQRLVDVALERGGGDNATAWWSRCWRPVRPGSQGARAARPARHRPLSAVRIPHRARTTARAPHHHAARAQGGAAAGPGRARRTGRLHRARGRGPLARRRVEAGGLIYPEALVAGTRAPDREMKAVAETPVRLLTIRRDDFFEITEEESELGVKMYAVLAKLMAR